MGLNTTFVAENGTGLANATSLVSVADFRAYWTARPLNAGTALTATDGQVQAALAFATIWANQRSYLGSKLVSTQALELPRYWPFVRGSDWDGMPSPILEAVCIVARFLLSDPTWIDPLERGGQVESWQVGPLAESYFQSAPAERDFAVALDLLSPFLDDAEGQELELG